MKLDLQSRNTRTVYAVTVDNPIIVPRIRVMGSFFLFTKQVGFPSSACIADALKADLIFWATASGVRVGLTQ